MSQLQNRLFFNQFNDGTNSQYAFQDVPTIATNTIEFPDPLVDWLPKACIRKKYIPSWHIVRSYK